MFMNIQIIQSYKRLLEISGSQDFNATVKFTDFLSVKFCIENLIEKFQSVVLEMFLKIHFDLSPLLAVFCITSLSSIKILTQNQNQ